MLKLACRYYALLLCLLVFHHQSYSQKASDGAFLQSKGKWPLPVRKYSKVIDESKLRVGLHEGYAVTFITESRDSVFAIHEGKVIGAYNTESDGFMLLVRFGNYFVIYEGLEKPSVSTGDSIVAGQFISYLSYNVDEEKYEINISLSKEKDKRAVFIPAYNWFFWNGPTVLKKSS